MRFRRRGVRAENQRAGRPGVLMRKLLPAREPCSAAEIASSPSQLCRRSPALRKEVGEQPGAGGGAGLAHDSTSPPPQHLGESLLPLGEEGTPVSSRARLGSGPYCLSLGRQRWERGLRDSPLPSAQFHRVCVAPTACGGSQRGGPIYRLTEEGCEERFVSPEVLCASLSTWSSLKFSLS